MSAIQSTLLAALLALASGDSCADDLHSVEVQLHTDLLYCGYLTDHRPVLKHETAVQVQVSFALRYYTFDTLEETLTMHATVAITWLDQYLQWDPADYHNISAINVAATSIWTPAIEMFNAGGSVAGEWGMCRVTSKGKVSCAPDLTVSALCATDLRAWPYDTQTCRLFFGSWIHSGEQVNYTVSDSRTPISFEDCKDGPGWRLLDAKSTWLPNDLGNISYPVLKYELQFRREAASEAYATGGAGAVVALLPLAAALGGNARLPLALFGVAAHVLALSELSWSVPRHGARSPRLLLACRTSLLVAVGGVLAALLLAWLRALPAFTPPPPRFLATLLRLFSSTTVNHFVFADLDSDRQTLTSDDGNPRTTQSQWKDFANFLDAFLCIIALIIYAVLVFGYMPRT